MNTAVSQPNRLPWPPMIYAAALAAGIALHYAYPLPWITSPLSELLFAAGGIAIVAVIAIDVSAMRTLSRAKTTIMPHRAADHLVTSGPFGFSRNPIYLANTMLLIGIALIFGVAWLIPMALVAAFVTQKLAIEREENHLEAKFGKKYRDYARRVRRWI